MILFCCTSELGPPPEDLSAIEVILYYYYCLMPNLSVLLRNAQRFLHLSATTKSMCCSSRRHGSIPGVMKPRSPTSRPVVILRDLRRSHGGGLSVISRDTLAPNLTLKTKFDFDYTSFDLGQVSVTLQTSDLHLMYHRVTKTS